MNNGEKVQINALVPGVCLKGQTGKVEDANYDGMILIAFDSPVFDRNNYPFKLTELTRLELEKQPLTDEEKDEINKTKPTDPTTKIRALLDRLESISAELDAACDAKKPLTLIELQTIVNYNDSLLVKLGLD